MSSRLDETKTMVLVEEGAPVAPADPEPTQPLPVHVTNQKPSLGRIVLYRSLGDADGVYPAEDHPAIVTGLNADGSVALHVFYRTGGFDMDAVHQAKEAFDGPGTRGKWRWPPRV